MEAQTNDLIVSLMIIAICPVVASVAFLLCLHFDDIIENTKKFLLKLNNKFNDRFGWFFTNGRKQ